MDDIENFHETKVIPFENMDDTYAAKAGELLYTYEGNVECFKRIVGTSKKSLHRLVKGFGKGLWDMVEGLTKMAGGLLSFAGSAVVVGACKPLDISPPKWASNTFHDGVETTKVFFRFQWISGLGQGIMDAVEEEGIFYAAGYTIGSLAGTKGLNKLGKAAKVAVQGTKLSSILKTATCVDDLLNAGVSTIDDLMNVGVKSVDDLLKVGVNTLDDLAKVGIHSIDDLVKVGATSADDLAKLGITSVEQLKKIGITSMDDLAKLGITSKEELAKVGVKSADDFIKGGSKTIHRPSWRQSEIDASKQFPEYTEQKSFLNGKEVPYGTKGSVRPDLYKKGSSIDVKNYKVGSASARSNLAKNIAKQYYQRVNNLPEGTKQTVLIDIRGQNVSNADLTSLYNDIMKRTNNGIAIKIKTN